MSDEEAFNKFLDTAGFKVVFRSEGMTLEDGYDLDKFNMLVIQERDSDDKTDYTFGRGEHGDRGFTASFMFDKDGKLFCRCVSE